MKYTEPQDWDEYQMEMRLLQKSPEYQSQLLSAQLAQLRTLQEAANICVGLLTAIVLILVIRFWGDEMSAFRLKAWQYLASLFAG